MTKSKKVWFCGNCGYESAKWLGRCPSCGEWNTMVEENVSPSSGASPFSGVPSKAQPLPLTEIENSGEERIVLGLDEFDRVLGGGLVKGSLVLIGGEPGIGKSTLSLQIPLACSHLKTLYVSGEESARQIKLRGDRLAAALPEAKSASAGSNCYVLPEILLENILDKAKAAGTELLIIDSIQTICSQRIEASAGSISQIRECAASLLRFAKESGIPVIIIGHITKDGVIAGPKILEHIVDVVLQFEGDARNSYRIVRSIKNRFGSTAELAVYRMTDSGLKEVVNPSEMFMPMHEKELSGIAVAAMIDGTRPMPQRSATGFDVRRMNMLLAVLEKRVGFKLSQKDLFLNSAGGMKITDPACDLSVVAAILSSNFDMEIPEKSAFAAEVGLSGEIRPVSQIERRIAEAAKLGFEKIYISSFCSVASAAEKEIEVVKLSNIREIAKELFAKGK